MATFLGVSTVRGAQQELHLIVEHKNRDGVFRTGQWWMEAPIQASLVRCFYARPLLLFYTLEHCNISLCTSLNVEAGSCIRYLKKSFQESLTAAFAPIPVSSFP